MRNKGVFFARYGTTVIGLKKTNGVLNTRLANRNLRTRVANGNRRREVFAAAA